MYVWMNQDAIVMIEIPASLTSKMNSGQDTEALIYYAHWSRRHLYDAFWSSCLKPFKDWSQN